MTNAGKSVYYFGFYLMILGITLTGFPNTLLSTFQLPETNEVWIRVVGVLVFNIGLYYVFMAPTNNALFYTLTIYTRASILVWFIVFVLIGWAPATLIAFGLADMAGAAWTFMAMRNK
ncbi:MAG: hypothetical protein ABL895_11490 [Cyclobacteriaceae bacterium]